MSMRKKNVWVWIILHCNAIINYIFSKNFIKLLKNLIRNVVGPILFNFPHSCRISLQQIIEYYTSSTNWLFTHVWLCFNAESRANKNLKYSKNLNCQLHTWVVNEDTPTQKELTSTKYFKSRESFRFEHQEIFLIILLYFFSFQKYFSIVLKCKYLFGPRKKISCYKTGIYFLAHGSYLLPAILVCIS